jgi:hypothetical protein
MGVAEAQKTHAGRASLRDEIVAQREGHLRALR